MSDAFMLDPSNFESLLADVLANTSLENDQNLGFGLEEMALDLAEVSIGGAPVPTGDQQGIESEFMGVPLSRANTAPTGGWENPAWPASWAAISTDDMGDALNSKALRFSRLSYLAGEDGSTEGIPETRMTPTGARRVPRTISDSAKERKKRPAARGRKDRQGTCVCCNTSNTPLWREGKNGVRLCNACGIRWVKYGIACELCKYVPRKMEANKSNCPRCETAFPPAEDEAFRRRTSPPRAFAPSEAGVGAGAADQFAFAAARAPGPGPALPAVAGWPLQGFQPFAMPQGEGEADQDGPAVDSPIDYFQRFGGLSFSRSFTR